MSKNFFTAALESVSDKPVGVDDIHTQTTLQPAKLGFREEGEEPSEEKPTKVIGLKSTEISEHDEIDTVAESQEHTLALEHLHGNIQRLMRFSNGLEELAEQVEDRVEAGGALGPEETAMLTTAVDASGIGAPMADSVALESFEFSPTVATEAFVEDLKDRAGKVKAAVAKFIKRSGDEMQARAGVIAATFKKYPDKRVAPLKKKIGAVEGVAGRNFEDSAREKAIQSKIYASSSSKTPLAALKDALAAYDAAGSFIDSRVVSSIAQMNRTYTNEALDKFPAAASKVLSAVSELCNKYSTNSPYSTFNVSVEVKTITPDNASKVGFDSVKRTVSKPSYDNSLKIASAADLAELETLVAKASRVFQGKTNQYFSDLYNFLNSDSKIGWLALDSSAALRGKVKGGDSMWSETKAVFAYRGTLYSASRAVSLVEMGLAEAVLRNALAAADWIAASIAEANAMKKAA